MFSHFIYLLVVPVFCYSVGCVPQSRPPEYSFGFYNATSSELLRDVGVQWPGIGPRRHSELAGLLGQHATAEFSDEPRPIPKSYLVDWTTPDGTAHQASVTLAPLGDESHFSGVIWFKITDDGVIVRAMTYAERDRMTAEGKTYLP